MTAMNTKGKPNYATSQTANQHLLASCATTDSASVVTLWQHLV